MRAWIRKLVQVRDTPEALARGLAVGFFFGVSFFWGLQVVLAVLACYLVRGNKVVAAAATAVSNPLTSLPLYGLCYFVGHLVMGGSDPHPDFALIHSIEGFLALGPRFFLTMVFGTTAVGLVGAVVVYFSSQRLLAALGRCHLGRNPDVAQPDHGHAHGEDQRREPSHSKAKERSLGAAESRSIQ